MKTLTDQKITDLFPFTPRGKQLEIVRNILTAFLSGKKHVVLSLPTGGGKSVIAYAVANYFKEAYVLTNQKILQEQYKNDLGVPYIQEVFGGFAKVITITSIATALILGIVTNAILTKIEKSKLGKEKGE